ncbi:hypothetical protein KAT24_01025 [Candidatus Pacearchaeota archaeon]|nr:hypothetical protein [Candidatus Pacearchaeota archaeon]
MKKWVIVLIVFALLIGSINFVSAEECAAGISITFNQDVYYAGDLFKMTVEVFDSQGNRIPNYPFYTSTYVYSEDEWGSSESPAYTNEQGYLEYSLTMGEIYESDAEKFLYKVYTEETTSCPKVEDTAEIEVIAGERVEEYDIPSECIEAGITDIIECSRYIYNLLPGGNVPEGGELMEMCREMGITTQEECDKLWAGEMLIPECVEAGATTAEECSRYIYDKMRAIVPSPPEERECIDSDNSIAHTRTTGEISIIPGEHHFIKGQVVDKDGNIMEDYCMGDVDGDGISDDYVAEWVCVDGTVPEFFPHECLNGCQDGACIRGEEPTPKPVPCGIGTCVPEEVEEVEAIPEEKIFYKCNGCELEGKCYPMGYRKSGKYCSDNYEFIEQLKAGSCDNHFECKSNICVSDECVGESLIKKIIKWFKRLFGGDEDEESGPEICSKLLIEKNIGDYEYLESGYGPDIDTQAPLFSDEGAHIGVVKCCVAGYKNANEGGVLICPYNSREDVENLVKWAMLRDQYLVLEKYKGQEVFRDGREMMIIWTHDNYAIVVAGDRRGYSFSEEIANAYLRKYRSDLEVPEAPSEEELIYAKILTCEKTTDSDERRSCYQDVAQETKNSSYCEKIEDRNALCYALVAKEIKDINLCEKINYPDGKHMCYSMVAAEMKDINLCEKITYGGRKEYCYSGVATQSKDITLCERITEQEIRNGCYFSVAVESEDVTLCERITDGIDVDISKDKCYWSIAVGAGDDSICEKIVDSEIRGRCYKDVPVGWGEVIAR